MTDTELIAVSVFVGMGVYISYLRHELYKAKAVAGMMAMVIHDLSTKDIEIERTKDGIRIYKHEPDREASADKC
jgi:hypothetical protein